LLRCAILRRPARNFGFGKKKGLRAAVFRDIL
jgi:hypothetical protein